MQNKPQSCEFFLSKNWQLPYLAEWDVSERDPEWHYSKALESGSAPRQTLVSAHLSTAHARSPLGFKYRRIAFNFSQKLALIDVTLERNGFFADGDQRMSADEIFEAAGSDFFDWLGQRKDWHQLVLECFSRRQADVALAQAKRLDLLTDIRALRKTYWVDLEQIRTQHNGKYLETRSANTRQRLRSAKRKVEQAFGELKLSTPASLEEMRAWFEELTILHMVRWDSQQKLEGFAHQRFKQFYSNYCESRWLAGELQLLKVAAGSTVLAYIANIVFRGHVYFIFNGIDYKTTSAFSPGLLAHWMAIEHNLDLGNDTYDFLVGTNRYKESLSSNSADVYSMVLERKTLGSLSEQALRNAKRALVKWRAASARATPAVGNTSQSGT